MEDLSDVESVGMGPGPDPTMELEEVAASPQQDDTIGRPMDAVTPEQAAEAAAAAAELATLEAPGGGGGRGRNLAGDQALMGASNEDGNVAGFEIIDESGDMVASAFLDFLMQYTQEVRIAEEDADMETEGDASERIKYVKPYHEQAKVMAERLFPDGEQDDEEDFKPKGFSNTLFLNFAHVFKEDPELAEAIQTEFYRFEPFLRKAIATFVLDLHPRLQQKTDSWTFYLAVFNLTTSHPLRQLKTDLIGNLSSVTATVTRTSDVRPELLSANFRCNKCGLLAGKIPQQFCYTRPTMCRNPRCKNDSPLQFTLETRESEFVDWQKLRVQENSDQIPPGSMPRSMDIILRNEMVERCKAGDKCVFVGSLVVLPDGSALSRAGEAPTAARLRPSDAATGGGGGIQGLKALGVRELTYRTAFVANSVLPAESMQQANSNEQILSSLIFTNQNQQQDDLTLEQVAFEFTTEQREEIQAMRQSPRLYEQLVNSICPSTFGHKEVKKGILLMLLGGVHKTTADGIKLRGDINVCVIGDPSTAKSQFLKYVHSFLPSRAVYTSGKASSAAGLTAAVQRDQDTGEYCIEAGALMLADNGICCIDEFDKMDPTDQVAIHEAMEQQTISITKAGIQATLNARASILAAANPIYGRYDRTKTLKANVALSAPILSRFDLFFVVLDECNPDTDRLVAQHILDVHRGKEKVIKPPFTKEQMQRYIRFVRTLNPQLTPESQRVLVDCYRKLRQGDTLGRSRSAYRITVRQLESMIRLSEAIARLYCTDEIQPSFVREAYRLLKTSIIQVETADVEMEEDDDDDDDAGNGMGAESGTAMEEDEDSLANKQDGPTSEQQDSQEDGFETQPLDQPREIPQPPPAGDALNPGEYAGEALPNEAAAEDHEAATVKPEVPDVKPTKKKKKKKTKITFEEYEGITNAIAGHLRASEGDEVSTYLTWDQALEWYLTEYKPENADSAEEMDDLRKKVNLVIRRLIDVDRILVSVGEQPKSKKDQGKTVLAVHPNYEVS